MPVWLPSIEDIEIQPGESLEQELNIVVAENGYDYELEVAMNGRVSEYVSY